MNKSILVFLFVSLSAPTVGAGVLTQVTDQKDVTFGGLSLDYAGSVVIGSSNATLGGQNPGLDASLYSWSAVSGAPLLLQAIPLGAQSSDSAVTDDGAWIAFISRGNLTGANPAGHLALFLRRTDGSETRQLSPTVPGDDGVVLDYALAGSGNRVAFSATFDPLTTNPSHSVQLFVVDADGSNLHQLTTAGFYATDPSISDDGTHVAFVDTGDLVGENSDRSPELFAIDAAGNNLHQLTSYSSINYGYLGPSHPRVSGNGTHVAFESAADYGGLNPHGESKIWIVEWAGPGLTLLTPTENTSSYSPAITDDGQTVFFESYDDNTFESGIWRVNSDGTGATRLTTKAGSSIQVSGDGSRVAFTVDGAIGGVNADGGTASVVMNGSGGEMALLADEQVQGAQNADMTADGSRLIFDKFEIVEHYLGSQLWRVQTDGSGLAPITAFTDGDSFHAAVADDGEKVVFFSFANPLGTNINHNLVPFAMKVDGTQLKQLQSPGSLAFQFPVISGNGSWVVFQSVANLQLIRMTWTGTSPLQITSDAYSGWRNPRIDANGVYVVYQNATGIARVTTSNTARQQITDYPSWYPDVSGNGTRYVWISNEDPLGLNPDGSYEIFCWDSPTNLYRQLSSLPAGSYLDRVRISRDGAYVTFHTNSPIFGPNPLGRRLPYRLHVVTGAVEPVGGFDALLGGGVKSREAVSISSNGSKLAFRSFVDPVRRNVDGSSELFFADMALVSSIRVSASSPTVVSWDAEPQAVRYDVVRGNVANLAIAGSQVDLGPVSCLVDDSERLDTSLAPDAAEPAVGQAFFYVLRGTAGSLAGPGSYGQGAGARERVAGSGGCLP